MRAKVNGPHSEPIKIVYTGLRPGEKMYEELLLNREQLEHTKFEKIFIGKADFYEYKQLIKQLDGLKAILDEDDGKVIEYIKSMVPEFGIAGSEKEEEENSVVKIYHLKNRKKKMDVSG